MGQTMYTVSMGATLVVLYADLQEGLVTSAAAYLEMGSAMGDCAVGT